MPTNRRGRTIKPPDDAFPITRPDQLQALGDATRWRILGYLIDGPASIQELARGLEVAKGTIGHHVRVLVRAGMIRLVEERRVRGVVEKRYGRIGGRFKLPDESTGLLSDAEFAAAAKHLPLRSAAAEARTDEIPDDPSTSVVMRARMPAARARRFGELIEALAEEFVAGAPGTGETFGFVGGVYVPNWRRKTEDR